MILNNLKALIIHLAVCLVSIIIYRMFHSVQIDWVSAHFEQRHHLIMIATACVSVLIAISLYYICANRLLAKQDSLPKAFMSTGFVAAAGAVFWLNAVSFNFLSVGGTIFNSKLWMFYGFYNMHSFYLIDEFSIENAYVLLIFSLLPSVAMGFGLHHKKKEIKQL
ncbi:MULTISPECIES: hypothetical protein [unclassified Fusibacter]|uniref:hypothetical protein n=1 Tax=unclassified Fusibacter TaxID=2624464 RepID=UPI0010139073|nr:MULTISPECIES: hypothetical protein [unclassified Fusibacter]MCK8058201.1 hypothetical protein [Fusibacter sp. A2]NPE20784.1 hypothetical protein [Fusibacter sp. A1]RXV62990.1 hypothetical protein DWB64_03055 [Fusibacter sp. A1]